MAFDPVALKAARPDTPRYFMVLADWLDRHCADPTVSGKALSCVTVHAD